MGWGACFSPQLLFVPGGVRPVTEKGTLASVQKGPRSSWKFLYCSGTRRQNPGVHTGDYRDGSDMVSDKEELRAGGLTV